jgi:two-component system nitrogen regulation sensor histidine kinase NtrY
MALQTPAMNPTALPAPTASDGRRLLALPGIAAIVGALISAGVSLFAVLLGLTPINSGSQRRHRLWLVALNAVFIVGFLIVPDRAERYTAS